MNESDIRAQESLATLYERIIAMLIDGFIIDLFFIGAFIIPIVLQILGIFYTESITNAVIISMWCVCTIIGLVCTVIYFTFMPLNKKRGTIGQRVIKIRVQVINDLEKNDYRPIQKEDTFMLFKRTLLGIIDVLFFGIVGIILIINDENNQSLADRITGTIVLYSEEQEEK